MTMKKHPSAFKLCGELAEKLKTVQDTPLTLYEGTKFSLKIQRRRGLEIHVHVMHVYYIHVIFYHAQL